MRQFKDLRNLRLRSNIQVGDKEDGATALGISQIEQQGGALQNGKLAYFNPKRFQIESLLKQQIDTLSCAGRRSFYLAIRIVYGFRRRIRDIPSLGSQGYDAVKFNRMSDDFKYRS